MKATLSKVAGLLGIDESEAEGLRREVFGKKETLIVEDAVRAYCDWLRKGGAAAVFIEVEMKREQLAKLKADRKLAETKVAGTGRSLADIAQIIGKKTDTLKKWIGQGCPAEKNGREWQIDVEKVFDWRVAHERELCKPAQTEEEGPGMLDLMQEQARLARAKADDQERKNRIADGELVTVEEVGAMYAPFGREVRQRLMSMGSKVGPKVGKTVVEQRRLKAAIDEETHKALNAINSYEESHA